MRVLHLLLFALCLSSFSSRLNASGSTQFTAELGRNAQGQAATLRRGTVTTEWQYGATALLEKVSTVHPRGNAFRYTFPSYDRRGRLGRRGGAAGRPPPPPPPRASAP